jgi:hypothetical protein
MVEYHKRHRQWRRRIRRRSTTAAGPQSSGATVLPLRVRPVGEEASLGYRLVSTQDFVLDGKELARAGAKVALQGFYVKKGAEERLVPSQMAVAFVTQGGMSASLGVVLLTDDAPRELRAYFLRCGSLPGSSQPGARCASAVPQRRASARRWLAQRRYLASRSREEGSSSLSDLTQLSQLGR